MPVHKLESKLVRNYVLLCIALVAGFWLGRVTVPLPNVREHLVAGPGTTRTRGTAGDAQATGDEATDLVPLSPDKWKSLARESGLDVQRPALPPAVSGFHSYMIQPFQVLSFYPRIVLLPNFLDELHANKFIELASRRLRDSKLALKKGETEANTKNIRTSQGTFLSNYQDLSGTLRWVEERISQFTGIPVTHFEPYNVLRYETGQHYDSHYDRFDPGEYGPQQSNRVATVLIYLSAPEEGGETVFPLEGEGAPERGGAVDYKSCAKGLKYRPRFGDAILFWSVRPDGTFDRGSLHGGCPVQAGTKWVATKWIRDKPF